PGLSVPCLVDDASAGGIGGTGTGILVICGALGACCCSLCSDFSGLGSGFIVSTIDLLKSCKAVAAWSIRWFNFSLVSWFTVSQTGFCVFLASVFLWLG